MFLIQKTITLTRAIIPTVLLATTVKPALISAVEGITCPACMTTIEQGLGNMPGINAVSLNYTTHRLTIEGAAKSLRLETILGKLDLLGYKGRPYEVSAEGLAQARAEKTLAAFGSRRWFCHNQYHDDVHRRVGGQCLWYGGQHARPFTLAFCHYCIAGSRLCRTTLFSKRRAGPAWSSPQHGCAHFLWRCC